MEEVSLDFVQALVEAVRGELLTLEQAKSTLLIRLNVVGLV
jgi:hypothetical protein